MIPDSENPLDGDRYVWPSQVPSQLYVRWGNGLGLRVDETVRDLRPWPVRFEEQMKALEERVRRLEAGTGQPGRRIVMLYWREGGQLATMNATVMHIKPDAPAMAVKALKAGMAAWVDEECAAGVIAEVRGE